MIALVLAACASPLAFFAWRGYQSHARSVEIVEAQRAATELPKELEPGVRDDIAQVRQRIVAARAAWQRAVTADRLEAVTPGSGACPIRLVAPDDSGFKPGNIEYAITPPDKPVSDGLDHVVDRVSRIERGLDTGTATRNDAEQLSAWTQGLGELLFVVATTSPGIANGTKNDYLPGSVDGRAYVYSYDRARVICVAPLAVTNAEHITFKFDLMNPTEKAAAMDGALERDLELRTKRAIYVGLVRVTD